MSITHYYKPLPSPSLLYSTPCVRLLHLHPHFIESAKSIRISRQRLLLTPNFTRFTPCSFHLGHFFQPLSVPLSPLSSAVSLSSNSLCHSLIFPSLFVAPLPYIPFTLLTLPFHSLPTTLLSFFSLLSLPPTPASYLFLYLPYHPHHSLFFCHFLLPPPLQLSPSSPLPPSC